MRPLLPCLLLLVGLLLPPPASSLTPEELQRRATLLERAGNYKMAGDYYQQLLQVAPDDSTAVHGLTRTLDARDAHRAIVDLLSPWLRAHPDDLEAHLRLGDAYRDLGETRQAIKSWRRALDSGPPTAELYLRLSDRCQTASLHDEAIRFLLEGRDKLGTAGLFSWELAQLYLQQREFPRAVDAFLVALRQNPQRYPIVELRLTELMEDSQAAPRILQTLRDALSRAATDPAIDLQQAAFLAALCALESGQAETGLQLLEGVAVDGEIVELLFQYAGRCEDRGQGRVAARAYALYTERKPDSPYLYRALLRQAEIAAQRGQQDRAALLYGQLVRRYPDRPEASEALFLLGELQLERLGDLQGARTSFETLLQGRRRDRWTGRALELLAEVVLRQGDLEAAQERLERLEFEQGDAAYVARFHQAELRYFQTDFNGAQKLLEPLLNREPGHPLANDALDLLLLCGALQDQEEVLGPFVRAHLLERQRHPEEAAPYWHQVATIAPPPLRELALLIRARARADSDDSDEALRLYQRLATQHPKGQYATQARVQAALIQEQRGDLSQALQTYETALLAAPDDAQAPEIRLSIQRLRRQIGAGSG